MKVFKFILITIIILSIVAGIPIVIYKVGSENQHLVQVEGNAFQGPMAYASNILKDANSTQEIKENVTKLSSEYNNLLNYEKKDMLNLFFATALILGVSIILFGIILLKISKYKLFSTALLTSGVISIICYIYIYITTLSTLT